MAGAGCVPEISIERVDYIAMAYNYECSSFTMSFLVFKAK